jgi:ribonuclease P/MRP protein subunit RPP1
MKYDLCLRIEQEEEIKEAVKIAKKLGWNGIGILTTQRKLEKLRKEFTNDKEKDFEIVFGICLSPKNPNDVRRIAKKLRRKTKIITVEGKTLEISRAALETPEVDVLLLPWNSGINFGMNYIMARLASKNNVSICFDFVDIIHSHARSRTIILSNMVLVAKLVRKFRTPFVITSGAKSPWDMRSPSELMAFGRILGFQDPEIKKAMSDAIVKENTKRLSDKWVMPGVEIEK